MGSIWGRFKTRGRAGLLGNSNPNPNINLNPNPLYPKVAALILCKIRDVLSLLKGKCDCLCEDELKVLNLLTGACSARPGTPERPLPVQGKNAAANNLRTAMLTCNLPTGYSLPWATSFSFCHYSIRSQHQRNKNQTRQRHLIRPLTQSI